MTETEKSLKERYGDELHPKVKVDDCRSLSQIIQQAKANSIAAGLTSRRFEPTEDNIRACFLQSYQSQVAWRNRKYIPSEEFDDRLDTFVEWLTGGMFESRWLYLSGQVGNGKSTSAKSLLDILGKMDNKTIAKKSSDIKLLYRNLDTDKRALTLWDSIKTTPVLYIDEFEPDKYMEELLDFRYDNMTITIISSNIQLYQLEGMVSDRIFDRMVEMTQEVVFMEESYRRRK